MWRFRGKPCSETGNVQENKAVSPVQEGNTAFLNCGSQVLVVKEVLKDVVPEKYSEDISSSTLLNFDMALDSIEIMDVLIRLREKMAAMTGVSEYEVENEPIFAFLQKWSDGDSVSIGSLCVLVHEIVQLTNDD